MIPGIGMMGMVGKSGPSDGKFMIAAAYNDYLYISNDYGVTWSPIAFSSTWSHVSCSSDGKYILATDTTRTYLSSDYGATWTNLTGNYAMSFQTAMSYDGKYMYRLYSSTLYYSSNYGATWSSTYASPSGVRCSADGKYVIVHNYDYSNKTIILSSDYGANFSSYITPPGIEQYGGIYGVDITGNGNTIIAGVYQGTSQMSTNRGATWSSLPKLDSASCSINYTASCFHYAYKKTSNYGATYTNTGYLSVQKSAYSASGQYFLYCIPSAGQLRLSNDYGATETVIGLSKTWKSVAIGRIIPT